MVRNSRFNQILIFIGNNIISMDFTKRIENIQCSSKKIKQQCNTICSWHKTIKANRMIWTVFLKIASQRKKEMFKLEVKIIQVIRF